MREKKSIVSNAPLDDPEIVFAREYAEAGVCSLAVLPLLHGETVFGVLALYTSEMNFFHQDEMKLLEELAVDIAFGIDHRQAGSATTLPYTIRSQDWPTAACFRIA
ncbi:MAG: GAF domain-containing protein [Haliea sp.]|nr:GAF domain-containing protein [Haliea sp.]